MEVLQRDVQMKVWTMAMSGLPHIATILRAQTHVSDRAEHEHGESKQHRLILVACTQLIPQAIQNKDLTREFAVFNTHYET